jgi:hypothetical protein
LSSSSGTIKVVAGWDLGAKGAVAVSAAVVTCFLPVLHGDAAQLCSSSCMFV